MGSIVSVLGCADSSEAKEQLAQQREVYETQSSKSDTETTPYSPTSTPTPPSTSTPSGLHPRDSDVRHVMNDIASVMKLARNRAEELDRNDIVRDLWNQAERRDANHLMTYKKLCDGLQKVTELTQDEAKFLFVPLG